MGKLLVAGICETDGYGAWEVMVLGMAPGEGIGLTPFAE